MNEKLILLEEFWTLRGEVPLIDGRSEGEFAQSRIPESYNLPILTDSERIEVGTLYKEKGSEVAILKGFELVGPRFHGIQKEAIAQFPERRVLVYCWRGGMRSQILAWILSMVGFEVYRLKGGYKTYRTFTYELVRKKWKFIVLGGKTGTGKTMLLQELEKSGEQIIDLENLANHKGSTFGAIGQKPQPTVEQFENHLAEALLKLDPEEPTWIENESRRIGRTILPAEFYNLLLSSPIIDIFKSDEERIKHISEEYASLPADELIQAVLRIKKRLGGQRTAKAIEDIIESNHASWIENLLIYYDKTYEFGRVRHLNKNSLQVDLSGASLSTSLLKLLKAKTQFYGK